MCSKKASVSKKIARAGVIAGLYTVTSLVTAPMASGAVQVRLSEALTLLPLIFIEAIPGLFVGCILSNIITGCAIYDVIFGSLITLIASVLTYFMGKIIKNTPLKIFTGGLFPVFFNALLLPVVWLYCYGGLEYIYIVQAAFLLAGQMLSVYLLGVPLFIATLRAFVGKPKKK